MAAPGKFESREHAMCRVPLLAMGRAVGLQHLVDGFFPRSQSRLFPFSVDYYLGFVGYVGSNRATIQQQGISNFPNCVQVGGFYAAYYPLSLVQILPPTPVGGLFYSNYVYQDTGFHPVPFYPYFSGAATQVNGVDVTTGQPFSGIGSVSLTVFRVQF